MLASLKKYKSILRDSAWSLGGLILMNVVAQILLYPFMRRELGEAGFGDMQYLMAYVNIITVSIGCAANLARMTASEEERVKNNGDYNLVLLGVSLLGIPFVALIGRFGGVRMDTPTLISYYFLFVAMAFRYYADVTYKISLNYRRYFLYYFAISVGYGIGIFLFLKTGIWPLAILPGEALGVLFAYICTPEMRRRLLRPSPAFGRVLRGVMVLMVSEGISNLIFNADRLILKILVDASAVTIYYLATLVGKTMSLVATPLNGVLIGYLARFEGILSRKMMRYIVLACVGAVVLFSGLCFIGGWIILFLLYREDLENVKPFLLIGSVAQVLYFVTNIVTVVLIRFAKKSYQVIINATFGICFVGFGIPATVFLRLWGFAGAMVAANSVRFLLALGLGALWARKSERALALGGEAV